MPMAAADAVHGAGAGRLVLALEGENKLRSLRLPVSSSRSTPSTYHLGIKLSPSPKLRTGTSCTLSDADEMSHRGTKGQENGSRGG
jgi:hypothetical protein